MGREGGSTRRMWGKTRTMFSQEQEKSFSPEKALAKMENSTSSSNNNNNNNSITCMACFAYVAVKKLDYSPQKTFIFFFSPPNHPSSFLRQQTSRMLLRLCPHTTSSCCLKHSRDILTSTIERLKSFRDGKCFPAFFERALFMKDIIFRLLFAVSYVFSCGEHSMFSQTWK